MQTLPYTFRSGGPAYRNRQPYVQHPHQGFSALTHPTTGSGTDLLTRSVLAATLIEPLQVRDRTSLA
jgi:hypothetical protein